LIDAKAFALARRDNLQDQLAQARQKLNEAQQVVNQLSAGCIQLQARISELDYFIHADENESEEPQAEAESAV
jgi:phage shock protein A